MLLALVLPEGTALRGSTGALSPAPVEGIDPVKAGPRPVLAPMGETYKIPVLMYHDIGSPKASLVVTPEMFGKQMEALFEAGYETVTADALLLGLKGERVWLPEKGVAITFDDGYEGVYRYAYPVLKSLGLKATLFVVTGLVGKDGYLTWDQLQELAAEGWAVGSHAVHHVDLRTLEARQLQNEVSLSRKVLSEATGQEILSFCYPSGKYDDSVIAAVEGAGYLGAFTTEPGFVRGRDAPFTLKRIRVDGRDGLSAFKSRLSIP